MKRKFHVLTKLPYVSKCAKYGTNTKCIWGQGALFLNSLNMLNVRRFFFFNFAKHPKNIFL